MNTIKFKIQSYDEASNSVIISFSSDETVSNDPGDYEGFAFQPISEYPDITDMEELKKKIAEQGIALAEMNKKYEDAKANTAMQNKWKALVGQTFEYNVSDILQPNNEVFFTNEINVPPTE